jgi:hypothetical protein
MVPFIIGLAESAVAIGALFVLGALKWIENSDPDPCLTEHPGKRWLLPERASRDEQRSDTDKPWCQPNDVVQGHAIWHLLTAAVTVILFVCLRTEIGAR